MVFDKRHNLTSGDGETGAAKKRNWSLGGQREIDDGAKLPAKQVVAELEIACDNDLVSRWPGLGEKRLETTEQRLCPGPGGHDDGQSGNRCSVIR